MARPTKFNQALSDRIVELAGQGLTDKQIAEEIGVSPRALANWKITHPAFLQSLKEAQACADDLVEASLFLRATGYSAKATKWFQHEGSSWCEEYIEHYPPDTTACIFWLKNRRPAEWRDRVEMNVEGSISLTDAMKEARGRAAKVLGASEVVEVTASPVVQPEPSSAQPTPVTDDDGEKLTLPVVKVKKVKR